MTSAVRRYVAVLGRAVPGLTCALGCAAVVVGVHRFSAASAWIVGGVVIVVAGVGMAYSRGSR